MSLDDRMVFGLVREYNLYLTVHKKKMMIDRLVHLGSSSVGLVMFMFTD
jgi:hypothetical protein